MKKSEHQIGGEDAEACESRKCGSVCRFCGSLVTMSNLSEVKKERNRRFLASESNRERKRERERERARARASERASEREQRSGVRKGASQSMAMLGHRR